MYYQDYDGQFDPWQQSFGEPGYMSQQATPMIIPPSGTPPFPSWQQGPSGISRCINRNTYIWLRDGNSFWFFPTFVGRGFLFGFRWGRFGWVNSRIDLRRIRSYQCF